MDQLKTDISSLWLAIAVLSYFVWRTRRQMKELIAALEGVVARQERRIAEMGAEKEGRMKDS
jgi:hypothetical protein